MQFNLIYCCFFLVLVSTVQSTLELVNVFFRHGSRTPEEKDTYPKDIYTAKDFMPPGWGQLTNIGKFRALKLGTLLRKKYETFLGTDFNPEMVYAQSTDFDRTKMSAQLVLAGLFDQSPYQLDHLPYNFEKAERDFFLRRPTNYCPRYVQELEQIMETHPQILKVLKDNEEVLNYIAHHTGKPMTTMMDVFRIYQTLNAEESKNMTLPQWTESVYPKRIHEIAGKQCYFENVSPILKRLNGGRSLSRVIQNMESKMLNGTLGRKIYLYSGHENNVVNILSALDVFDPHVPKYSAAVIVELHNFANKEMNDYKVRILYIRDVYDKRDPEVKIIGDCEEFCPYHQFIDITRPRIPINYTEECESSILLD